MWLSCYYSLPWYDIVTCGETESGTNNTTTSVDESSPDVSRVLVLYARNTHGLP